MVKKLNKTEQDILKSMIKTMSEPFINNGVEIDYRVELSIKELVGVKLQSMASHSNYKCLRKKYERICSYLYFTMSEKWEEELLDGYRFFYWSKEYCAKLIPDTSIIDPNWRAG